MKPELRPEVRMDENERLVECVQGRKPRIGVFPKESRWEYEPLLDGLAKLWDVEFEGYGGSGVSASYDAILGFGVSREVAVRLGKECSHCIAFVTGKREFCGRTSTIEPVDCLPPYLRGREVREEVEESICPVEVMPGDVVVARKGTHATWIRRSGDTGITELVGMSAPRMTGCGYLYEFFQRSEWLRLLPLIYGLRALSPWRRPNLRACLMIDDPNLHWKNYGYVRFEEVARHARDRQYHLSFATVPLDGWLVHGRTAEVFRQNRKHISLLIHGNNHTRGELGEAGVGDGGIGGMAQAIQRTKRFEQRSRLQVARVMAAPHGVCNAETADALTRVGFEAACISRWSLMQHNPHTSWDVTVGMNPAERLGYGLPIIPRFKLAPERELDTYLSALLDKPIIVVGHQEDLKEGMGLVEEFVDHIESIGNVEWMDMRSIARTNYSTRRSDERLEIKAHARRLEVMIPADVKQCAIRRGWPATSADDLWEIRQSSLGKVDVIRETEAVDVAPGIVQAKALCRSAVDPELVMPPRTPLMAIARRGLSELRDRSRPVLSRLHHTESAGSQ